MKSLKKLLIVIASAGMAGSAPALDQINLGAHSPAVPGPDNIHHAASVPTPYSLMHILDFAVDKSYRTAGAAKARQAPAGTGARRTHVADLKLDKLSVASLAHTDWLLDGAWIDIKSAFNPDGRSARVAQDAGGGADEAISLSAAAVPEPDGWMQLLCGLVVVAFMARRRTNLAAG